MKFDPLISIKLNHSSRVYRPGEILECEYQIDAIEREELKRVEVSTLWYTTGKGDEEESIHFYERRTAKSSHDDSDLRQLAHFSTPLPPSPLSYSGTNLNIVWCVRIRIIVEYSDKGPKEFKHSQPFQLHAH